VVGVLAASQPKDRRKKLVTIGIACCQRLWLERNSRVFQNRQATEATIIRRIQVEIQLWILARQKAGGVGGLVVQLL
jgi:hypothetical protein